MDSENGPLREPIEPARRFLYADRDCVPIAVEAPLPCIDRQRETIRGGAVQGRGAHG